MSRLKNSFKTILLSFANSFLSSILGFISRTVFIYILGSEYLGLSGILNNIFGFLSITELGIASAIGFSLYKPLAEKDYRSVSALMSIYRKAYRVIGCIVLLSGIALFPFLDFFISPDQQPDGITYAYFLFLINIGVSYFISYKTTLLSSDNHSYEIVPISAGLLLVQTLIQIGWLFIFRNYVGYLAIQIGFSILISICQNRYITKKYTQVDFHSKEKLTPEQKHTVKKNISGLVIANIGDYLVNSTDNLIITKFVSLSATGIYSNYLLIRNIVNGYIGTLFGGITAGMGNAVAIESDEKKLELFDTLMFFSYFIYSFEAVCMLCLFNPFIGDLWIGKEFLFNDFTMAIIVINNYLTGLRMPLIIMKSASGIFIEDSWVPFAFGGINLVASIILAKYMGVAGVFIGTMIGSLLTADWYRPIVIYKKVFHASVLKYYKKNFMYVVLAFSYMALAFWLCSMIKAPNVILTFCIKALIAMAVPLLLNCLLFRKTKEFKKTCEVLKRLGKGIADKIKKRKV